MATPIPSNRCAFTAAEIVEATAARPCAGGQGIRSDSVSVDSRTIPPGGLFIALKGVRDGHEFLDFAAGRGAIAAIVERGRGSKALPCFEVDDTLAALGSLARHHLRRLRRAGTLSVAAIGGAVGKTTTKELTGTVVRSLFADTLATSGNL